MCPDVRVTPGCFFSTSGSVTVERSASTITVPFSFTTMCEPFA